MVVILAKRENRKSELTLSLFSFSHLHWIKSNAVDVVIQFQSRSDAITQTRMEFKPAFRSRNNNYPRPIIVPIGSRQVDTIETSR